ncbi:hypothetical protein ACFW04_011130 [Cataglyphis niger]
MIMAFDAALIVTKDRMVYGLGNNCNSQLGIGNVTNTLQPKKVEALCGKNIKTFCCNNCMTCIFALTEERQGFNGGGLGQGLDESMIVHTPTRMLTLSEERIVNIACSNDHSLALTETGKVYTWGNRKYSEIFCDGLFKDLPWQVKYEEKIVRIACGLSFNVAITDSGKICSWGINNYGQLGVDKWDKQKEINPGIMVLPKDITIVKIVCGSAHTLALTRSGTIYSWGRNNMGQLGHGTKTEKEVMSTLISSFSNVILKVIGIEKVLDIAARHNGSLAVNKNGCVYIWGQCFNKEITVPTATTFSNMYDVLSYNIPYIIHKPLNEIKHIEIDFTIKVQGKLIHVHKVILNIRSQHFKNMFQNNWLVQGQSNSSMLVHDQFSYNVYKAFLKYLYTGVIDLALEETLDEFELNKLKIILLLIKLADSYDEKNLKRDCIQMIKKNITLANVVRFYYKAIEYEAKEVKEFCFKFAQDHMMDGEILH